MALIPESWLNNAKLIASSMGLRYARQDSTALLLKVPLRWYALNCVPASAVPSRCNTAAASASRPLTTNQRGLCGITNNRLKNAAAGNAPDSSFQRQTSGPGNTVANAKLLKNSCKNNFCVSGVIETY